MEKTRFSIQNFTEIYRFMDRRVREILHFFVAPQCEFAPAVWRVSRTLLSRNTSTPVEGEGQEYPELAGKQGTNSDDITTRGKKPKHYEDVIYGSPPAELTAAK